MITRRNFMAMGIGLAGGWFFSFPGLSAGSVFPQFFFTQFKYRGEWDPNPLFVEAMVEELELRTSIDATRERRILEPSDPAIFYSPFLYMAGRYEFEPFTHPERQAMKRFLSHGGFLFAEDTVGANGFGFDQAFRREMQEILPDHPLRPLAPSHSVHQSFYLISSFGGRQKVKPYLEGITIGNWTPVIYSQNDLSGAWARDRYGKWVHECVPGGDTQRSAAFKMGINLIVYCLTADYKRDLVHHPFIEKRQNL
ncbi:MAG: DUF4159 domain-containing protein [Desulfobacterales bacterium]|nr:DUF4159 domain-containing protein [Desulfobacterales bacterium]